MDEGNLPIYENASITKLQALLLVLTFALRHTLCDQALQDLLSLLNILCPGCVPETKHLVSKIFGDLNHEVSNFFLIYIYLFLKTSSKESCVFSKLRSK